MGQTSTTTLSLAATATSFIPTAVEKRAPGTFHILSMNTYLIPYYFVNKDNKSCTEQLPRSKGIGAMLAKLQPDIICLQEMWGSCGWGIEYPLVAKDATSDGSVYQVLSQCQSWGFTTVDAMMQYANSRGGLWMAYRKLRGVEDEGVSSGGAGRGGVTACLDTRWATFPFSNTKSKKGMVASLYRLNGGGKASSDSAAAAPRSPASSNGDVSHLLVINLHLDPFNLNAAIEKQMSELRTFVRKLLLEDSQFLKKHNLTPEQIGLLIVGDYNIKAGSDLAKTVFEPWGLYEPASTDRAKANKMRDLYGDWAAANGRDAMEPTYDAALNSYASYGDSTGRIDLQMGVDAFDGIALRKLECIHGEIVKQPRGKELSDHWAVHLELKLQ